MPPSPGPSPAARLLSRALVGAAVVYLFGRRGGTGVKLIVAVVGVYAHERFDAPVAKALSDLGI